MRQPSRPPAEARPDGVAAGDQRVAAPRARAPCARAAGAEPAPAGAGAAADRHARCCGCGGSSRACPTATTPTRPTHFVPRAIAFFSHDYNPHYFLNPPAYSYLLHIVFELWFGSADAVARAYATDPTEVFVVARVVAAVLGTLSVWLTYLAGARMFNRTVGLLAAAIFGFAFLPIFYSHLALNDVPTLAPVALSLYGDRGRVAPRRAARLRARRARRRPGRGDQVHRRDHVRCACWPRASATRPAGRCESSATRCALALADRALVAFVIANPYSLLDFSAFSPASHSAGSLAGRRGPGEARHDRRQRDRVLPVDVHLGARLGADARRDRRRGRCCWSAGGWRWRWCCCRRRSSSSSSWATSSDSSAAG